MPSGIQCLTRRCEGSDTVPETFGPFGLSKEMEEQRLQNLATANAFMELVGPDRHERRKALYASDGIFELTFCGGPYDKPNFAYRINDPADVSDWQGENADFPDWGFFDTQVYPTHDPYRVFIECGGRGMRYAAKWDEPHFYENHYLLCFTLKDGKIKRLREIFNPFNCMRPALDAEVPEGF